MRFHISIFDNAGVAPIGNGVLKNDGNDFEQAAQGILIVQGVTLKASLKLNVYNPAQTDFQEDLYDEKL